MTRTSRQCQLRSADDYRYVTKMTRSDSSRRQKQFCAFDSLLVVTTSSPALDLQSQELEVESDPRSSLRSADHSGRSESHIDHLRDIEAVSQTRKSNGAPVHSLPVAVARHKLRIRPVPYPVPVSQRRRGNVLLEPSPLSLPTPLSTGPLLPHYTTTTGSSLTSRCSVVTEDVRATLQRRVEEMVGLQTLISKLNAELASTTAAATTATLSPSKYEAKQKV